MLEIVDQGILSRQSERGSYMPWITPLPEGGWIACQHVGTGLGSPDNRIEVLRSGDGRDWAATIRLPGDGVPDDGWSYRGPQISCVPDGRLVMTATRFENAAERLFDPDSEALQRPEMLLFWSGDRGATWSAPQVVPVDLPPDRYTCNGAGQLLQLSAGRWMYPFETWKPPGWAGPPDQKAAALYSADQGRTWGELTVVADDPSGRLLWWDQMNTRLTDGRLYALLWTHVYGTSDDLVNHCVISDDEGRTWSTPTPTNLPGQVCAPIALADGRVAAVYNHRRPPQGVRVALSENLGTFDLTGQAVIFDAGAEATLGIPDSDNFLAEHQLIAFGKPGGRCLADGQLLTWFWCTVGGVTHTRWVRLAVS